MTISYAVTVCNEFLEIQRLLPFLIENIRKEDEIVVLYDSTNGDKEVENYLRKMNAEKTLFQWHSFEFKGDFAEFKNHLTTLCSKDYIFQIDADEMIPEHLFKTLPDVLNDNSLQMYKLPRINTVEGLTEEHIQKWGWNVNEEGWINFPDYQERIYKNDYPRIKWKFKVHEKIDGYNAFGMFPPSPVWSIIHTKDIKRQEKQNELYSKIRSNG